MPSIWAKGSMLDYCARVILKVMAYYYIIIISCVAGIDLRFILRVVGATGELRNDKTKLIIHQIL